MTLPDRTGPAAAIKKALAQKGHDIPYTSIRHSVGQLQARGEASLARKLNGNGSPASIAAERVASGRDFAAGTRALLETTYLVGLRQAGLHEESGAGRSRFRADA